MEKDKWHGIIQNGLPYINNVAWGRIFFGKNDRISVYGWLFGKIKFNTDKTVLRSKLDIPKYLVWLPPFTIAYLTMRYYGFKDSDGEEDLLWFQPFFYQGFEKALEERGYMIKDYKKVGPFVLDFEK